MMFERFDRKSPQFSNHPLRQPSDIKFQREKWADYGLGFTALVLATIFGVGAWVRMNMQYYQGAKGLKLAIWTACANHEVRFIFLPTDTISADEAKLANTKCDSLSRYTRQKL